MSDTADAEILEIPEMDADAWAEYVEAQGWTDGLPLVPPGEAAVARMMKARAAITSPSRPSPRAS